MTRITTCLACNHVGDFATFEVSGTGVSRMKCPKCGSTSRFATSAAAQPADAATSNETTKATAASAAATVETNSQESDMATEAPTKKRRGKAEEDVESEVHPGEQLMLIDITDPKYKELKRLSRKFKRIALEREDALNEKKQEEDDARAAVIAEMQSLDVNSFTDEGHTFILVEKAGLKMKAAKPPKEENATTG